MPPFKSPESSVWVNKTPTTYNTRTSNESYAINSYINGNYARWRRKEKQRRLRAEIQPEVTSRTNPIPKVPLQARSSTPSVPKSTSHPGSEAANSEQTRSLESTPGTDSIDHPHLLPPTFHPPPFTSHKPHPSTILQKGNSDPFTTTSVSLTPLNHFALHHACSIHAHHVWPRSWGLDFTQSTANYWLARRIASTPALMQAVLAWSFSQILTFRSALHENPFGRRELILTMLEHKFAGLKTLKALTTSRPHSSSSPSSLSKEDLPVILESMLYHGEIDWHSHSPAVLTHFRAARIMLSRLGGLSKLSREMQETVIWDFVNISFTYPIRPLLNANEFDPGPWAVQTKLQEGFSSIIGDELLESTTKPMQARRNVFGLASRELTDMFSDLSEVAMLFEVHHHLRLLPVEAQRPIGHWAYPRRHAVRVRLTCLWRDMREREEKDATTSNTNVRMEGERALGPEQALLQKSLCLCLRICDLLTFGGNGHDWARSMWVPYRGLLMRYLMVLSRVIRNANNDAAATASGTGKDVQVALLWMYFVGSYLDQVIFPTDVSWCSDQFQATLAEYGYTSSGRGLQELSEKFQREFFYVPTVHDGFLNRISEMCDDEGGYKTFLGLQQRTEEILDKMSEIYLRDGRAWEGIQVTI